MNRILILAFVLLATTTSMADAGKKGSKVSFPNNVSGASFIRACENSGGQIDGGDNTLSCTKSSSETIVQQTKTVPWTLASQRLHVPHPAKMRPIPVETTTREMAMSIAITMQAVHAPTARPLATIQVRVQPALAMLEIP